MWVEAWLKDRRQRVCLNGVRSDWRSVFSGVPQGSVLGPELFLIFINDLEFGILSSVFKFADDTKVLGRIVGEEDCLRLQNDIDALCNWSDKWLMKFNVAKCKVMHHGNGNSGHKYSMNGYCLDELKSEKDLGVIISHDLKVFEQCQHAYSKANSMLGLLKR